MQSHSKDLLRKLCGLSEAELEKGAVSLDKARALASKLDFDGDVKELKRGIEVEMEHSDTVGDGLETAAKIAIDHLEEDPKYYTKLSDSGLTESMSLLRKFSGLSSNYVNESNDELASALKIIKAAAEDRDSYQYSDALNRKLDGNLQNKALKALDTYFNAARENEEYAVNQWRAIVDQFPPDRPEIKLEKLKIKQVKEVAILYDKFIDIITEIDKQAIASEKASLKDIENLNAAAEAMLNGYYKDLEFERHTKELCFDWVDAWDKYLPIKISSVNNVRSIVNQTLWVLKYKAQINSKLNGIVTVPLKMWGNKIGVGEWIHSAKILDTRSFSTD